MKAHLLQELHVNIGVVRVGVPHLIHGLESLGCITFQHADVD